MKAAPAGENRSVLWRIFEFGPRLWFGRGSPSTRSCYWTNRNSPGHSGHPLAAWPGFLFFRRAAER